MCVVHVVSLVAGLVLVFLFCSTEFCSFVCSLLTVFGCSRLDTAIILSLFDDSCCEQVYTSFLGS